MVFLRRCSITRIKMTTPDVLSCIVGVGEEIRWCYCRGLLDRLFVWYECIFRRFSWRAFLSTHYGVLWRVFGGQGDRKVFFGFGSLLQSSQ